MAAALWLALHRRVLLRVAIHVGHGHIDLLDACGLLVGRPRNPVYRVTHGANRIYDEPHGFASPALTVLEAGIHLCHCSGNQLTDLLAAERLLSAKLRTSIATTAKPRPCSPREQLPLQALSARMLVLKAMLSITLVILDFLGLRVDLGHGGDRFAHGPPACVCRVPGLSRHVVGLTRMLCSLANGAPRCAVWPPLQIFTLA